MLGKFELQVMLLEPAAAAADEVLAPSEVSIV